MITGVTAISATDTPIYAHPVTSNGLFQGDANSLITQGTSVPALTIGSNAITIGGNLVRVVGSSSALKTINGALTDGQLIYVTPSSGTVTLTSGTTSNLG